MAQAVLSSAAAWAVHEAGQARLTRAIARTGIALFAWETKAPERSKWGNTVTHLSTASGYADETLTSTRYFLLSQLALVQAKSEVVLSLTLSAMPKKGFTASARITGVHKRWPLDTPVAVIEAEALALLGRGRKVVPAKKAFDALAHTLSTEMLP